MHFQKNKNTWAIACLFTLATLSCRNKEATVAAPAANFNRAIMDSLFNAHGDKLGILMCLRCDCFRATLNQLYKETGHAPSGFVLMADSTCTKLNFPFIHLPNAIAGNMSEDIYNLVLLRRDRDSFAYKILSVNESPKMQEVADEFFAN